MPEREMTTKMCLSFFCLIRGAQRTPLCCVRNTHKNKHHLSFFLVRISPHGVPMNCPQRGGLSRGKEIFLKDASLLIPCITFFLLLLRISVSGITHKYQFFFVCFSLVFPKQTKRRHTVRAECWMPSSFSSDLRYIKKNKQLFLSQWRCHFGSKPTDPRSIAVVAETCSTLQSSTKREREREKKRILLLFLFSLLWGIEYLLLQPRSAPKDASDQLMLKELRPNFRSTFFFACVCVWCTL